VTNGGTVDFFPFAFLGAPSKLLLIFGIIFEPVFAAIFPPAPERVVTWPCMGTMMSVVGGVMLFYLY
jgi:hypothetical protein